MKIKQCILKQYPKGIPEASDFEFKTVEEEISLQDQQVFLKLLYISVDPYLRVRLRPEVKGYFSPFPLGKPIISGAVGQVIESKNEKFPKGTLVSGLLSWQTYVIVDVQKTTLKPLPFSPKEYPPSYAVGILGMPGLTAYFGLLELGQPKKRRDRACLWCCRSCWKCCWADCKEDFWVLCCGSGWFR